jgi:hypothetical protein
MEFGQRSFLPFANLMNLDFVPHADGQDAPGNQGEEPTPGGFAAIGATAADGDHFQGYGVS